jgi:hypothetical protein
MAQYAPIRSGERPGLLRSLGRNGSPIVIGSANPLTDPAHCQRGHPPGTRLWTSRGQPWPNRLCPAAPGAGLRRSSRIDPARNGMTMTYILLGRPIRCTRHRLPSQT